MSQGQSGQVGKKPWGKDVECYNCHSKGHIRSKCPKLVRGDQEQTGGRRPVALVHAHRGVKTLNEWEGRMSAAHVLSAKRINASCDSDAPGVDNGVGDQGNRFCLDGSVGKKATPPDCSADQEGHGRGPDSDSVVSGDDGLNANCEMVKTVNDDNSVLQSYKGFISQGVVSAVKGQGDGRQVTILRDTGASQSLLLSRAAPVSNGGDCEAKALVQGIDGGFVPVPLRRVNLKSKLVTGVVTVGIVSSLPIDGVDFLLGNDLAGDRVDVTPVVVERPVEVAETEALQDEFPGIFPACVVTRSQSRRSKRDLENSESVSDSGVFLAETFFKGVDSDLDSGPGLNRDSLIEQQKADPEVGQLRQAAMSEVEIDDVPDGFYLKDDVLMRKWRDPRSPASDEWSVVHQVVLPPGYRPDVLRLAHEAPMAGHVGIRRTQSRIMAHFFWPQLHKDVVQFCRTCHVCQVVGKPQPAIKPAPLMPVPAFEEPFSKVMVDCVGPLPRTKSGIFRRAVRQLGMGEVGLSACRPESREALERCCQTPRAMLGSYCLRKS